MHADERKVAPLHPLPNPGAVFHHHNQHSPAGYLAYHQSTYIHMHKNVLKMLLNFLSNAPCTLV